MISLASETLASERRAIRTAPRTAPRRWGTASSSSVDVPEHGVDRGDDGHRVGDEAAAHHVRQALEVEERRAAHVHPVRPGAAVAGDVAAELAARALDRHVDLALGHLEALGEDLEVVDQGLHR